MPPRIHPVPVLTLSIALVGATAGVAVAQGSGAGPGPDGTGVIPVGYRVTPAGEQSKLGNLPLTSALSPDGKSLVVSNDGQGTQSLQVVDPDSGTVKQTVSYQTPQALFAGLAFSPDGHRLYASAGGNNKIRTYDVSGGRLTETTSIPLPATNPAGQKINMFPADLAVTGDGKRLVVADQLADAASVIDVATGLVKTVSVGHAPYGVALSSDGKTAYVSNQGANTVSELDISGADPNVRRTIGVGTHPNRMLLDKSGDSLYVANGDSDTVSVVDTTKGRAVRSIGLAPYAGAQVGSNPDALALTPDGSTLYVANSGNNDVAVVDVKQSTLTGLIPTAWYPTTLALTAGRLLVANAKGLGAGPNTGPGEPNPESDFTDPAKYTASMMVGTLSRVSVPASRDQLDRWTRQVSDNNGFDRRGQVQAGGGTSVIPRHPGEPSPIKHVIYVVRENRTYDQVMGSLGKGNGDASENLFGDESATNARELSRRFVTLDNFYANAEVSAQGWNWVVAGNSNPYSEQTFPANYSSRNHPYPSENDDPEIAPNKDPNDAYIWQRLNKAKVTFRNYGFYVGKNASGQNVAGDPVLNAATDHAYNGFDLSCPDAPNTFTPINPNCGPARFAEWKREFQQYEANGNLPKVEMVRLPSDHTAGTMPGAPTPKAYVADNDWALGQLVDTVSHSKDWQSTAIFVTEDDSQNGPDHVDAHRTASLVISPYTQTGAVDSTFYSTDSMLRTIELIAGLRPLTQFDAYSTPMIASFSNKPNDQPYDAKKPTQNLQEVNGANAPMAKESARQNLSKEDQIDEQQFNMAIWKSVKGARSTMPPPKHSVFGSVPNQETDG